MKREKLVIGQRYFLDSNKDVSGVYIGGVNGSIDFNEIQGYETAKNKYGYHTDGEIGFYYEKDSEFYHFKTK